MPPQEKVCKDCGRVFFSCQPQAIRCEDCRRDVYYLKCETMRFRSMFSLKVKVKPEEAMQFRSWLIAEEGLEGAEEVLGSLFDPRNWNTMSEVEEVALGG